MPFIQIKVFEGVLSEEKKKEMISRVTEVVAEIEASPHPKEKLIDIIYFHALLHGLVYAVQFFRIFFN